MMTKVIPPGSWDFVESAMGLIKMSRFGLRGNDRQALIKRAGYSFADAVDRADIRPGEIPVHLIAMGSQEKYGANRNGDGFKEATLRRYHDTFVKRARYFRNHKNKDPQKSYGIVKASTFNEPMSRVELLVCLNGTKEAAVRNGGLLADLEMEKTAKSEDIPVSMACGVSHDICSSCGNRARTRADYCKGTHEGGLCKHGGCTHNLAKVAEDGHHLHVDNPDPTFIDISGVIRPADRIAFGGVADYLMKAASADEILSGAELAERFDIQAPADLVLDSALRDITNQDALLAVKLAYAIVAMNTQEFPDLPSVRDSQIDVSPLSEPGTRKCAEAMAALAKHEIVLPVEDFVRFRTGREDATLAKAAAADLPKAYERLLHSPSLQATLINNPFKPANACSFSLSCWAEKYAADYALTPAAEDARLYRAVFREVAPRTKTASEAPVITPQASNLASEYVLYQLAALCKIAAASENFDLTVQSALRQNRL